MLIGEGLASIALGITAALGAAGGITSAVLGSNAAQDAGSQQAQSAQDALEFQKQVFQQQQQNQAPYLAAGYASLGELMDSIKNGTFGPGSLGTPPPAPTSTAPNAPAPFAGVFTPPTAEQARATPGYEFTREEGTKGILQGASAAGGAISGGTLKALDQYNTN